MTNFKGAQVNFFDRVKNIAIKGENTGYLYFPLFPQCFQKASSLIVVKTRDCLVW